MYSKLVTRRGAGYIAGGSLLLMTVISIVVFPSLKVSVGHIAGIAAIILLDLIVAVALYYLLRSVNKNLSLYMAASRLVYAAIFAYALSRISDLSAFQSIWDKSLLLFGIHLLLLGILVYRSGFIPKWLGILILLAAVGYIIDSIAKMFGTPTNLGIFTFFGEVLFAIWLVVRSGRLPKE